MASDSRSARPNHHHRMASRFSSSQLLLEVVLFCFLSQAFVAEGESSSYGNNERQVSTETSDEVEPAVGVLFPWFALAVGTFVYLALTRFLPWIPYTAVMFVIGTIMGVAVVRWDRTTFLTESITYFWLNIDSEVLLLVFLPGLVAKDAMQLDATLFRAAFWQCIIFAFPMVLAGTVLTALVCYYIFPYGWSFNLAMTVGSILSATDPVAVAALMAEVGAPARLQIHISGESLLNDGSAIVFFTIFSQLFLLELGVAGLGSNIGVAQGFAMFFQMSLGAVASGIFFGFGTRGLLYLLKRRLNREENVVEVATTFTMAYLCYFVTDVVWGCSGVIGTLTYGVLINMASSLINDHKLQDDFWALVEHLLNTVLFTLGGLVWGEIIANGDPNKQFLGKDWGYLVLLYLFLIVIRFFLMFSFFPITANLGLKTNWQETVFSSYAGLRGAVGIALAIYLDNVVNAQDIPTYELESNRVFGFVGGIAFFTLVINATTSGPILKRLGLADITSIRRKVVKVMEWRIRQRLLDDMVVLLSESRFHLVNFAVVRHHIPMLQNLTLSELESAVRRFKRPTGKFLSRRSVPKLTQVTPYLESDKEEDSHRISTINRLLHGLSEASEEEEYRRYRPLVGESSSEHAPLDVMECRCLFVELLRASYAWQVESGELADRDFLVQVLNQSLDLAGADVAKGGPLNDWDYTKLVQGRHPQLLTAMHILPTWMCGKVKHHVEFVTARYDVERCMAFLEAHRRSREVFKNDFIGSIDSLTDAEARVLEESEVSCQQAQKLLESFPSHNVEAIISHRFCTILLNVVVLHFEHLAKSGLISSREADEILGEIQDLILRVDNCRVKLHPGELNGESTGTMKPVVNNQDNGPTDANDVRSTLILSGSMEHDFSQAAM